MFQTKKLNSYNKCNNIISLVIQLLLHLITEYNMYKYNII